MKTTTLTILSTALCCVAVAIVSGQQPITKTNSATATATIQAIDSTARIITLKDESGQEDTYKVGPEVKRFDELKVGDTVKMTYNESLVLQVRKAGQPDATTVGATGTAGTGARPSGTVAAQAKTTVTVKAIDPAVPSITVTTSDGRTVTRKVEDKKNLEGVNVGDLIDITYTVALVTAIERRS